MDKKVKKWTSGQKIYSKICSVKGCGRKRDGRHSRCSFHHKLHYNMRISTGGRVMSAKVYNLSSKPCAKCGWSESFVDRHRLDKEKGYVDGNVIPLCPNCHRIETMDKLGIHNKKNNGGSKCTLPPLNTN